MRSEHLVLTALFFSLASLLSEFRTSSAESAGSDSKLLEGIIQDNMPLPMFVYLIAVVCFMCDTDNYM